MSEFWEKIWKWRSEVPITEGFRSDRGPHAQIEQFMGDLELLAAETKLPSYYMKDSLVGIPPATSYKDIRGNLMTRTSIDHALMVETMQPGWKPKRVLEIGGGFGGLAWSAALRDWPATRGVWPTNSWTFVDHPAQLAVQEFFTERALPDGNFVFLEPRDLKEDRYLYDLAICARAFGEMDSSEVKYYGEQLSRVVEPQGFLYIVTWVDKITSLNYVKAQFTDWKLDFEIDWPWGKGKKKLVQLRYERV